MRILRSVRHKNCADGSFMKEFLLDVPVTKEFFYYLGHFGNLGTLPGVGEGYFKFEKPDWFSVRGFVGDTTVEVRFKKEVMELTMDFVYLLFSSYNPEKTDLAALKERESGIDARVRKYLYGT